MKTFKVMIEDAVTYYIKDEDETMDANGAVELALEWFAERIPNVLDCEELEPSSYPAVEAYC